MFVVFFHSVLFPFTNEKHFTHAELDFRQLVDYFHILRTKAQSQNFWILKEKNEIKTQLNQELGLNQIEMSIDDKVSGKR